jgi:hypothetical protein
VSSSRAASRVSRLWKPQKRDAKVNVSRAWASKFRPSLPFADLVLQLAAGFILEMPQFIGQKLATSWPMRAQRWS